MSRLLAKNISKCFMPEVKLSPSKHFMNPFIRTYFRQCKLLLQTHIPWQRQCPFFNLQKQLEFKVLNSNYLHSSSANYSDVVNITYIDRDDESHTIAGKVGDNVMYLAQKHDLDVEGACEASLACCTCHVYVEKFFEKLDELDEEEEDMLDLAPFLQENSRLSCQILLSKELDGIVVRLPSATRNFYVDGHKPKPH